MTEKAADLHGSKRIKSLIVCADLWQIHWIKWELGMGGLNDEYPTKNWGIRNWLFVNFPLTKGAQGDVNDGSKFYIPLFLRRGPNSFSPFEGGSSRLRQRRLRERRGLWNYDSIFRNNSVLNVEKYKIIFVYGIP